MSVPRKNFVVQQGEDTEISIVYKQGDPPVPVDLTQGWSVRMDVRNPANVSPLVTYLYTFNSDDIITDPEGQVDQVGTSDNEILLFSDGRIAITIPRSATLPGGGLGAELNKTLFYDIFVRSPEDKQKKVLEGTIYIQPSQTRWA